VTDASAAFQRLQPALTGDDLKAGPVADLQVALADASHPLSEADMAAFAGSVAALQDKAKALSDMLAARTVLPDAMLGGALQAASSLSKPAGDAASGTASIRKVAELLQPLVARLDPALAAKTFADLSVVERGLSGGQGNEGASAALVGDLTAMRAKLMLDANGKTP
jgi:iron uptake system component EfeO